MDLDPSEVKILQLLQEDARIPVQELAEHCGLSLASVQRRLKRLRDAGIIAREVAILDPAVAGNFMTFIVMVDMERERLDQMEQFTRRIMKDARIQQCYYVTGDADFCLICVVRDMEEFEALTHAHFFDNANVRRFHTSVVMGRRKFGTALPVG